MTDEDLLALMVDGDESAFTSLYRRRQPGIYRFALHMSGSPGIAEEVTQEVFMTLIRQAKRFEPGRGSLSSYLYGIGRNFVLRCLERDRSYVELNEDQFLAEPNIVDDLTRSQTIESVREAVLKLPRSYREAVVLCDLEELTYVETAAALGCAVGTVRSRLHRGRALLSEKLRPVLKANAAWCST